jgi:hypothetical protein
VACGAGRHAARLSVMARLLIVHHTPSPATQEMFEAVLAGAMTGEITGVGVVTRPALIAAAADALNADGYLLGPHANIGYMSGALKHFFDGICYRCLTNRDGRPPIRAVRTRKQRHHRRRQGGGGHRHRAEMAARQVGCDGGRPAAHQDLDACLSGSKSQPGLVTWGDGRGMAARHDVSCAS